MDGGGFSQRSWPIGESGSFSFLDGSHARLSIHDDYPRCRLMGVWSSAEIRTICTDIRKWHK